MATSEKVKAKDLLLLDRVFNPIWNGDCVVVGLMVGKSQVRIEMEPVDGRFDEYMERECDLAVHPDREFAKKHG